MTVDFHIDNFRVEYFTIIMVVYFDVIIYTCSKSA